MEPKEILSKLVEGRDLEELEAEELADAIVEGKVPETLTASILTALRIKGEKPEEILGFVRSMRKHMVQVDQCNQCVDTAGTGGDGLSTMNASTASAIAVGGQVNVMKHGNRAMSGRSGSADFLEEMGYNIYMDSIKVREAIKVSGFAFLFAQLYHPAMKNVANVRRTLGIKTVFNLLGPLTNPAGVKRQVMGVFSKNYMRIIGEVAVRLGYERLLVVHGEPGIDELSPIGNTWIVEVKGTRIDEFVVSPSDFGISGVKLEDLKVSSPRESVEKFLRALKGRDLPSLRFLAMNMGAALLAGGKVKDLLDGYEQAISLREEILKSLQLKIEASGGDLKKFRKFKEVLE